MTDKTPILILDGGLGTSLEQKYNIKFDRTTPLWSSHLLVSDPDLLQTCQADFGAVPVDILLTATYQVSIKAFQETKTSFHPDGIHIDRIPQYLETALRVGEAASKSKLALSLGPYGACMIPSQEYSGKYDSQHNTQDDLLKWHTERMQLFSQVKDISSRVAYVSLETIPRKDEIIAMRQAFESSPHLSSVPFWMSCLYPGDDSALPDGTSAEEAVEAMLDPTESSAVPWGVGINCTKVWKLDALLQKYETKISKMINEGLCVEWPALVLYPDGTNGEVYNTTTQQWEIPEEEKHADRISWEQQLADVVKATQLRTRWKQIVLGGCCMARAEDIQRLRQCVLPGHQE